MSIGNPIPIKTRPHSGLELLHALSIMAVCPLCSGPNGNHEDPLPSLTDAFLPLPCSMASKSQHQLVEHPEKPRDRGFKWNRDLVLCLMGKQEHILVERPESATSRVYKEPLETKTNFIEMPGSSQTTHITVWDMTHPGLRHIFVWKEFFLP